MKSDILTLVFWGLFYLFDGGKTLLYIFVSASFHESAHLFFYYLFKARIKSVKVLPFGISAEFYSTSKLSYAKENAALFAGPAFNLAIAFLSYFTGAYSSNLPFVAYNVAYFALNMLPIYPLDGGRIFGNFLLAKFAYKKAVFIRRIVSGVFILLLFAVAVVFSNFSLIAVGSYLAVRFFCEVG